MSSGRVAVIGGGLAGIAAALDCAEAGAEVTLVEVRRRLGGAAYAFERDGLHMDNGQHVFLRCCLAYRGLLARLGSESQVQVQPRLEIPVLKPGSPQTRLRRSGLPAPLHLAGALLRYPHLSRRERLSAGRAALALTRLGSGVETPDSETFGGWLARRGQSEAAIAALWDLIALPTLNVPAAEASLELAAFVFRTGLLSSAGAGDIGFHVGSLHDTIGGPAHRELERAGVRVMLGWRAEQVHRSGKGLEVHGRGGRAGASTGGAEAEGDDGGEAGGAASAPASASDALTADAVILALPHMRAAPLLEPLLGDRAQRLLGLGTSPIVNLHVLYDRPVLEEPFAAGVGTPVQYLFDRTAAAGAPPGTQYLAVSLSGADREMGMSVDALRERYVPAIAELLPPARTAKLEYFAATREHAATFRAAPGVGALRPGAETPIAGLHLAGAWTATGWPATLEGAVLSGHTAARSALGALGVGPPPGQRSPAGRHTDAAASAAAVTLPVAP
ncbi:MAG TPA: hydroxysqualene dehydroxylase HpnE [Solirubrobacteraceae bacterium]|nr:hydroxysqualene dehydroxylase HpnE [Solirubrobacteraceae bacterium]